MKKVWIINILLIAVITIILFAIKNIYKFNPVAKSVIPTHTLLEPPRSGMHYGILEKYNIIEISKNNQKDNFSENTNKIFSFPENMELLEEQGANIPELTHFDSTWYIDSDRIYTDYEMQMLEEQRTQKEYLSISSTNSSEEVQCYWTSMYPIKTPRTSGSQEFFTAYKISDSNLYAGTILSNDEKKEVVGMFILKFLGHRLEDGLEISVGYFNEEVYNDFYSLKAGVHQYDYTIIEGSNEEHILKERGEQVIADDYSKFSGIWYPKTGMDLEYEKESYLELTITSDGEASGHMLERNSSNKHQPFYGEAYLYGQVIGNKLYLHYDNDCFDHSGNLTITFYERYIFVYLVEEGEPNVLNGFNTGTSYYHRGTKGL